MVQSQSFLVDFEEDDDDEDDGAAIDTTLSVSVRMDVSQEKDNAGPEACVGC